MGMFDFLKNKPVIDESEADKILDGAESNDVVVPDHVKNKVSSEAPLLKAAGERKPQARGTFRVTGVYAVGGDVMLSGVVLEGKIKKKMKTKVHDKESTVLDIKVGSASVIELALREEGTLFLRGKNLFLVRNEDVLEFK